MQSENSIVLQSFGDKVSFEVRSLQQAHNKSLQDICRILNLQNAGTKFKAEFSKLRKKQTIQDINQKPQRTNPKEWRWATGGLNLTKSATQLKTWLKWPDFQSAWHKTGKVITDETYYLEPPQLCLQCPTYSKVLLKIWTSKNL